MTYSDLKLVVNDAYASYGYEYVKRRRLGADQKHSNRENYFVKVIYKVLLNQNGDETTDQLTKEEIQSIIKLFNKYSDSIVPIEYT